MLCKIIPDFPNYRIWENGTIESKFKSTKNSQEGEWYKLNPILDKSCGYYIVTLSGKSGRKNKRVHRLLAEAFLPNPDNKAHVNHINADKLDNSLSNLEWATPKENTNHAISMGIYDPKSLRNTEIIQLCKTTGTILDYFPSFHEAERKTKVAWQNIWKVCNAKRKSAGGYVWAYK